MSQVATNDILLLSRIAEIVIARKNFWEFCKLREPSFYKENRWHLKLLANTLQDLYEGRLKKDNIIVRKLIANLPPRHGKTRTIVNFCMWALGRNSEERIIAVSYNEITASDLGKFVRDGIKEEKFDPSKIVYSDIFPEIKIKHGSSSVLKWALEGQHFNFLSTSPGGSATSKGASILIIDDMIKSAAEAFNIRKLDNDYSFYTDTLASRTEVGGGEPIELVCNTPWAKNDISGRIRNDPELYKEWYHIKIPAFDPIEKKMLCSAILNKKRYDHLERTMDEAIFSANYKQERIDIKGRLYSSIKTYDYLPVDENKNSLFQEIRAYIDTADQGDDYLCSIIYGVYNGEAYILDAYYTQDGMEKTEKETARRLAEFKVNVCKIESNNGGRGFARNVRRELAENYKDSRCVIRWFHQSKPKISRIMSESAFVQEHFYFPENWRHKLPIFYQAVTTFMKSKKNKHDDAADALTGAAENIGGTWTFA